MQSSKKSSSSTRLFKYLWVLFTLGIVSFPAYIFTVYINLFNLYGALPSFEELENPRSNLASELYAADGKLLGKYFRDNRSPVAYNEISPSIIHSLLAVEDCRFEQHSGIDLKGIMRAVLLSVLLRKWRGGGSTLSQQLAKNLFKTRSKKYRGLLNKIPFIRMVVIKTKEWVVAVQLERAYTKKEIMTMYLNTVDFGSNAFGIKVAASRFFNKDPDQLTLEESALLVGLLRAPSDYSPILHPERSLKRRNVVLYKLFKNHFISEETYRLTKQIPIQLDCHVENYYNGLAPYFRVVVRDFLVKWAHRNNYDLFGDGLKIYTTLDTRMQKYAEEAVEERMHNLQDKFDLYWEGENPWIDEKLKEIKGFLNQAVPRTDLYKRIFAANEYDKEATEVAMNTPRKSKLFSWDGIFTAVLTPRQEIAYYKRFLHAGFLAMDPHTGHIKAWVGGINAKFFQYDHVKQGARQPGSLFKPIVYATAIENGFAPKDKVLDVPVTIKIPGSRPWTPKNWQEVYTGKYLTLRKGMASSINSITAYLMKQLGPQVVIDCARRLGITSHLNPYPSLCLGPDDVTLFELVGSYSAFTNKGQWIKPYFITKIEDKHGNVIQAFVPERKEAISEKTANLMIHMLKGTTKEEGGTARLADPALVDDNELAVKTGSTSNQSDGWSICMTSNLTVGVWTGGEDRCIHFRNLRNGSGFATAFPVAQIFFLKLYQDPTVPYQKSYFPPLPKNLEHLVEPKKEAPKPEEESTNGDEEEEVKGDKVEEVIEPEPPSRKLDVQDIF